VWYAIARVITSAWRATQVVLQLEWGQGTNHPTTLVHKLLSWAELKAMLGKQPCV
jgi:hypothetical protein